MGTRSLTVFIDCMFEKQQGKKEVAVLYRQMDGYPAVHGADLKEFFSKARITNGYSVGGKLPYRQLNGMGSAACDLITYLVGMDYKRNEETNKRYKDAKMEGHQFHLEPAGQRNCGEEYIYTLSHNTDGEIFVEVDNCGELIYQGKLSDFDTNMQENDDEI